MFTVKAKLLGNPVIYKDDQQITFPYKKAEALFYYLLMEKRVRRDILISLLWGTSSEKMGRKSLRNAVYVIRKAFGENVFVSPQRAIIMLNSEINFIIDVEDFIHKDDEIEINTYSGSFLEGFFVEDADGFMEWMVQLRDRYKDLHTNRLQKKIMLHYKNNEFQEAEKYCKTLIAIDELDESAYRFLMKIYRLRGDHDQAIDLYNDLVSKLRTELSITPDKNTSQLYEEIMKDKSKKEIALKNEYEEFFFGREEELQLMKKSYESFIQYDHGKSFLIIGEAGIGKSKLIEEFLKSNRINKDQILFTFCYQAEEDYLLKPWHTIFSKLSNIIKKYHIAIPAYTRNIISHMFPTFIIESCSSTIKTIDDTVFLKYEVIENAIIEMLQIVSNYKKLIFVFEDLQWADSKSISLLRKMILENTNHSMMIIGSCRNENGKKIEFFMNDLINHNLIRKIYLKRFDRKEVADFATAFLSPQHEVNHKIIDVLYQETEGNPFFMVEFLKNLQQNNPIFTINSKMADIVKSRFINLSNESKKIANILSVFFDGVTFKDLQILSGTDESKLKEIIEELRDKQILKEMERENDIMLVFTHQKLREFLYLQLSLSRKKILHKKIGTLLESKLTNDKRDVLFYSKLIYHFSNASDWLSTLKYTIKNLEEYLDFNHEVFPVVHNEYLFSAKVYLGLKQGEARKKLEEVETLLKKTKEEKVRSYELQKLELSFLYMLGRYYIRQGDYEKGIRVIEDVIQKSLDFKEYSFVLKGYRQMIYYCINTQNVFLMEEMIERALKIANSSGYKDEIGILYRLKGLLKVMQGDYEEGEKILKHSIDIFNNLHSPDQYIINIAAAYNYIGESKRHNKKFEEAIDYYQKAISICQERRMIRGLATFYTNAGLAAFERNDFLGAKNYFYRALSIYLKLDLLWGRSIVYGHLSLLLFKEGQYQEALQNLEKAEEDSQKLQSPYEMALVLRVKAEIAKQLEKDHQLREIFSPYINKSCENYCNEGISKLKNLKGYYEIEILKELKK